MAHQLEFAKLLTYDVGEPGITLQASLKLKEQTLDLQVKVDTGASCCLFDRRVGEALGFDIETGMRQLFGTATGTFVGYGHEVTLSVAEFEFDTIVFFPSDLEIRRNILGRFGWLDRVVLGLVDYEGKLYLSRYGL
ncbi:MAG TPA: aspartyl protease family protein, partial [Blastocatellia bacterium]|nr:aspartyl protease family protein [Blastocatellia bacterium]